MSEKLQYKAVKTEAEDIVRKIIDIFETEDGRLFEDKKKEVLEYLQNKEDTLLAERIVSAAINDETGRYWKKRFWEEGEVLPGTGNIVLRKVTENDREMFLQISRDINVYQMHGNQIMVRTLDLNLPFTEIAKQLDYIVERYFGIKRVLL